jgi:hypothetical protein
LKKVNKRKYTHLSILAMAGLIMITQYQNCAPAPRNASDSYTDIDGAVHVINPVQTSGIVAFADKHVAVASAAASVVLNGSCRNDQVGSTFQWQLRDVSGNSLADGLVDCTEQGFEVEVAPMQDLDCESTYAVVAQFGVSESEAVLINRNCQ